MTLPSISPGSLPTAPVAPVRPQGDARRNAFFAAAEAAGLLPTQRTEAAVEPAAARVQERREPLPEEPPAGLRPGSLLDIRV